MVATVVTNSSLTGPRYASDVKAVRVIHFEVLLNDGTLSLSLPRNWREQILRINLILQLLVTVKFILKFSYIIGSLSPVHLPSHAEQRQQHRNDNKISRMFGYAYSQMVKRFIQCLIDT